MKLAAVLQLPPGKTLADGPFPTVVEYSGYAIAGPHSLIDALLHGGNTNDPLLPSTATIVGSVLTPLLGFATLSVQIRGTGCSGGAYDLFGLPTDYDGYDAVQIAAAQPWALHHKVGMVGISYSGISQMMVAGTDPARARRHRPPLDHRRPVLHRLPRRHLQRRVRQVVGGAAVAGG